MKKNLLALVVLLLVAGSASAVPIVSYDSALIVITDEIAHNVVFGVFIFSVILAVGAGLWVFKQLAKPTFDKDGHFL